jgi:Fic-DOC domain mobile mystery protein B
MASWRLLPGETPIDPSNLKLKGITKRSELDWFESENIRKAAGKYLNTKPTRARARFDLFWVKKLHREMFKDVWNWAGKCRTHDVNLGVPWHQVEMSLQNLLDDLLYWENEGMHILEQSVRLHHRAVSIHPFENGNGRWSRLLANVWLRLHEYPITEWPDQTIGAASTIREEYLAAIKAADQGYYEPLLDLHRRYTPAV